ncbi:hypothetical protein Y032_0516g2800 [Ancylostoma ceylanicum]|uniref:Uncharacterized protein n=1 Tax=Ancylostoma ceylanicum TaxID=53326 RepID=A0A016WT39_9BILA|nr:hypothetical protein Y032_0516g2800 [Ancylostoma ceylanicum]
MPNLCFGKQLPFAHCLSIVDFISTIYLSNPSVINQKSFFYVCKKVILWTGTFYRALSPRAFFSVGEPGSVAAADAVTSSVPDTHWVSITSFYVFVVT